MKVLWLCNMVPGCVQEALGGKSGGGLWTDHVLSDLQAQGNITIRILCPWRDSQEGILGNGCSFCTFPKEKPETVSPQQETLFLEELRSFRPDVIHIWGTEFGHTLAMVRACETMGWLDRTVVGIQGLCHYVAQHYTEGLPLGVQLGFTLRDFLRQDNLLQQQKTFFRRGDREMEAISKVRHVMGRTHWDRACIRQWNPQAKYHFCNETLREEFYTGAWTYESCQKHRIFTSSRLYPIKGFHYVLEAFAQVRREYPDAVLAVPGKDPLAGGMKARLRQDSYARYLARLVKKYQLQGHVEYLGSLTAEQMKQEDLKANVFVLASTVENSSNSLGEAMLLGVPCAASDVGGVTTMLHPGEGIVYPSAEPNMLAEAILEIFRREDQAEAMGAKAAEHARKTHDPAQNLQSLLTIYRELAGEENQ